MKRKKKKRPSEKRETAPYRRGKDNLVSPNTFCMHENKSLRNASNVITYTYNDLYLFNSCFVSFGESQAYEGKEKRNRQEEVVQ